MSGHDASKSLRDRLAPEMLLYGLIRAVGRFTRSGLSEEALADPDDAPDLEWQVLAAEWETSVFEPSTGRSRLTSDYGMTSTDAPGPQTSKGGAWFGRSATQEIASTTTGLPRSTSA